LIKNTLIPKAFVVVIAVGMTSPSGNGEAELADARRDEEFHQSSSLTARHLSPSRNISRLIYLVYLFRA